MGLFDFIHKNAISIYQKDLSQLIQIYSKIDKRELADYFIFSVWTRAGLQVQGHFRLPNDQINLSSRIDYSMYSMFKSIADEFKKKGSRTESAAISIWAHSANGIINEEMHPDLKRLWALICSTKEYWDEYLNKNYSDFKSSGMDQELLDKVLLFSKQIINETPPEQFR